MSRAYGWQADGKTIETAEAAEVRERWAPYLLDQEADPQPSLRGLAADLQTRGVSTVAGGPWSPTVLRRALVAPRMIGCRFDGDGQLVDAGMEPILDRDTWDRLRALLLDPARQKFAAYRATPYLLQDKLARCAVCGYHLTYAPNGDRDPGYTCSNCNTVAIKAALIEADITERVLARLTDATYRRQLGRALAAAGTVEDQQRVVAEVGQRLEQLGQDYAEGLIDRATLLAGTDRARATTAAAERLITALSTAGDLPGPSVDDVLAWWEDASIERRHAIVALLLDHVVVRSSEGRQVRGADRLAPVWRTF
ncbi:recombinase family protein [Nocardia sp. NPDC059246]|uniref:recombinase family protein n=1 Tax=unclassified Nocardia TaxID=2637762 RepID=UPI0036B512A6